MDGPAAALARASGQRHWWRGYRHGPADCAGPSVGHWKRECLKNADNQQGSHNKVEMSHLATDDGDFEDDDDDSSQPPEFLHDLAEDAVMYMEDLNLSEDEARTGDKQAGERIQKSEQFCLAAPEVKPSRCIGDALARKLLTIARPRASRPLETRWSRPEARSQRADVSPKPGSKGIGEASFIVTVGAEGVVDTGAGRTVVGSDRVKGILESLGTERRQKVRKVSSKVTFRFGNSGALDSKHAVLIPASEGAWIRVEVVQGSTPLLLSNRLLKALDAVLHVRKGMTEVPGGCVKMRSDKRGLSIVDFAELMQHATASAETYPAVVEDPRHEHEHPPPAASRTQTQSREQRVTKPQSPQPSVDQQLRTLSPQPRIEPRATQHAVQHREEGSGASA